VGILTRFLKAEIKQNKGVQIKKNQPDLPFQKSLTGSYTQSKLHLRVK